MVGLHAQLKGKTVTEIREDLVSIAKLVQTTMKSMVKSGKLEDSLLWDKYGVTITLTDGNFSSRGTQYDIDGYVDDIARHHVFGDIILCNDTIDDLVLTLCNCIQYNMDEDKNVPFRLRQLHKHTHSYITLLSVVNPTIYVDRQKRYIDAYKDTNVSLYGVTFEKWLSVVRNMTIAGLGIIDDGIIDDE
jgi:hypothetical protein